MKTSTRLSLLPLILAVLPATARADFLDGQVLNGQGQGVPNVNINIYNLGSGGQPPIQNDGTDANGFFHVTVPAGTYDVEFRPPQPPLSNGLITMVTPVTILGTTNIGQVTLTQGAALSGHVVNAAGAAVPGVNFDVLDAAGNNIELQYDTTDALGNFAFASPLGAVRLRFDTTPVIGQTVAPLELPLDLSGDLNLGTIQLAQGFVVTAIVHRPGGQAVDNCDLDCQDQLSGETLYTPSDNTNSSGLVDTIVPAGTYSFEFCPPANLMLAASRVGPVAIGGNTFLGIVNLVNGVTLSGNLTSVTGVQVANAHVKVFDQATGNAIPVCDNNSNGNGHYQVIVPPGTYSVEFRATAAPWSRTRLENVVVAGNTTLNATLPYLFVSYCFGDGTLATACPCANTGLAGRGCENSASTGGAQLSASGWYLPDSVVLTQTGEPSSVLSIFLQGSASNANGIAFGDGLRCVAGSLKRLIARNATAGSVAYPQAGDLGIQARSAQLGDVIAPGTPRFYQVYYRDPNLGFCPNPPGSTFNVGNAVQVNW
jgi:Carboxypeptidase regulatory-like domain